MLNGEKRALNGLAPLVFLMVLLASPSSLCAQALDGTPEHVLTAALDTKSTVVFSGVMQKQLGAMGDAAAVAITKVLAGSSPQPDVVDRVLLAIEISFEYPEKIAEQADQKPRTALFVLASLDQRRLAPEQIERLVKLRKKLTSLAHK